MTAPTSSPTAEAILDATFAVLGEVGLRELSLERVATTAGVSRQTVYRHFGNRRQLIEATVAREEQRMLDTVRAATRAHHELGPALRTAIGVLLRWAREHPLLDRLLADEPADLLPYIVADSGVLEVARQALVEILTDLGVTEGARPIAADALARLMVSYVTHPPAEDPEVLAAGLALVLDDGLGALGRAP